MKKNKTKPSKHAKISQTVETVVQEFTKAKKTFGATSSNKGAVDFLADVVHNKINLTAEQLREALGLCTSGEAHWNKDCEQFSHSKSQ